MLKMTNFNISGASVAGGKEAAYFSAAFNTGGFTVSKNVTDKEHYENNAEECETDYKEFEEKAMQYAKSISEN